MMRKPSMRWAVALVMASVATPALAWGPATREAIVMTAVRVVSKEGTIMLSRLERLVVDGAMAPREEIEKLYPDYTTNPVRAVETEMRLLSSARGERVDPYFAYRLGVLGRITADLTAPMLNENPTYRERYYADADENIRDAPLKTSARRSVDAVAYFARIQQLAKARNELIVKDYQSGLGFGGIAKGGLPEDMGRSIDAVADVWTTTLVQKSVHANVSEEQLRSYALSALDFYIKRGNTAEIDANYQRLTSMVRKTADMTQRIGDMFYAAGMFERAIAEYEAVHAAEPDRKDVVEKIANYYVKVGDEALEASHLKVALDSFTKAAQTNPLHPDAEAKRLKTEALIAEKESRLDDMRRAIEEASQLQTQSEQMALQRKFADAMTTLEEAQAKYETVTDEFPTEFQAASTGIANIMSRMRELKGELIANTQSLSGTSFGLDMQPLAVTSSAKLSEEGLQSLTERRFNQELDKLRAQLKDAAAIR